MACLSLYWWYQAEAFSGSFFRRLFSRWQLFPLFHPSFRTVMFFKLSLMFRLTLSSFLPFLVSIYHWLMFGLLKCILTKCILFLLSIDCWLVFGLSKCILFLLLIDCWLVLGLSVCIHYNTEVYSLQYCTCIRLILDSCSVNQRCSILFVYSVLSNVELCSFDSSSIWFCFLLISVCSIWPKSLPVHHRSSLPILEYFEVCWKSLNSGGCDGSILAESIKICCVQLPLN